MDVTGVCFVTRAFLVTGVFFVLPVFLPEVVFFTGVFFLVIGVFFFSGSGLGLKPVMTLATRLIAIRQVGAGESVGYGATWVAPRDMRLGVAAIGYADGYTRHLVTGTPVLVGHERVPLVGRVSMDMITMDLSGHPQARVGDRVTLWGQGLAVEEIAANAATIPYHLLCGVTQRVEREYL